jgi:NAD(P)-dependent dehydrogenase (short-subunit alcohol dehydrogenase family)
MWYFIRKLPIEKAGGSSTSSTDEKKEASNKRHPLQRIGNPDEISKLVSFLLSEDASWMTGQIIGIDGGMGSLKV